MAIFISTLVFIRSAIVFSRTVSIRKQEYPRWNFIINMRTAERLLNNSTVARLDLPRRTLSTLIKNVAAHSPCSLRPRAYRRDRAFGANIVKKRKTIAYPLSISLSLFFLLPILFPPSFKPITVLSLVPDPSALSHRPFHASNPFAQRESLPYERQMNIHAPVPHGRGCHRTSVAIN